MKLQYHLQFTDLRMIYHSKKYQLFYQKNVDAEEKANGNTVDSQEQIRQTTPNENMIDYCQFTMQSLMECYEIVGRLKGNCIIKSICLRNIAGDQSYLSIVLFTPWFSAKSYVNKNVKSLDALTISDII